MSSTHCSQLEPDAQRARALRETQKLERKEREEAERARLAGLQKKDETKIAALAHTLKAVDVVFLDRWTGDACTALTAQLAALTKTAGANPAQADLAADELAQRLQALRAQAEVAYGRYQTRRDITGLFRTLLTSAGYSLADKLSDPKNPLGDFMIEARHSSGKRVSLQLDLELKNVRMILDASAMTGSPGGSDCARDYTTWTAALAINGIRTKPAHTETTAPASLFPVPIQRAKR